MHNLRLVCSLYGRGFTTTKAVQLCSAKYSTNLNTYFSTRKRKERPAKVSEWRDFDISVVYTHRKIVHSAQQHALCKGRQVVHFLCRCTRRCWSVSAKHLEATLTSAVTAGKIAPKDTGGCNAARGVLQESLAILARCWPRRNQARRDLGEGLPSTREAGDPIPSLDC